MRGVTKVDERKTLNDLTSNPFLKPAWLNVDVKTLPTQALAIKAFSGLPRLYCSP